MKKIIFIMCILLLLCSCGRENGVSIEDFSWKLETAYNENGEALEFDEVILNAKDGKISVAEKYEGKYYNAKKDPRSIIYEIEIGSEKGLASTSFTYYEIEENKPTLVINIGGYAMYFCKAS